MIPSRQTMIAGAVTLLVSSLLSDGLVTNSSGQDSTVTPPTKKNPVNRATIDSGKSANDNSIVLLPVKAGNAADVFKVLEEQFRGKVEMLLLLDKETPPKLLVKAAPEIQAEIRGVINFLDSDLRRWPAATAKPNVPVNVNPAPPADKRNVLQAAAAATYGIPAQAAVPPMATSMSGIVNVIQAQATTQPRIDAAMKRLRDAKSDDDKQAAKAALRKVLAAIFEEDMATREKQAKEIENRLTKLRQQYQDRQKSANEILDLQLKALENEAAGLEFPSGGGQRFAVPLPPLPPPVLRTNSASVALPQPMANNRVLEQFKKAYPTQERVGQLVKDGHFVGSPDAKMYAYVEKTSANTGVDSIEIRVCDAATGKLMAVAKMLGTVGRLQFTDEGVATIEADGRGILRVPLREIGLVAPRR